MLTTLIAIVLVMFILACVFLCGWYAGKIDLLTHELEQRLEQRLDIHAHPPNGDADARFREGER